MSVEVAATKWWSKCKVAHGGCRAGKEGGGRGKHGRVRAWSFGFTALHEGLMWGSIATRSLGTSLRDTLRSGRLISFWRGLISSPPDFDCISRCPCAPASYSLRARSVLGAAQKPNRNRQSAGKAFRRLRHLGALEPCWCATTASRGQRMSAQRRWRR